MSIIKLLLLILCFCRRKTDSFEFSQIEELFKALTDPGHACKNRQVALMLDKPVYKNQETMVITAYQFDRLTKKPLRMCDQNPSLRIEDSDGKQKWSLPYNHE